MKRRDGGFPDGVSLQTVVNQIAWIHPELRRSSTWAAISDMRTPLAGNEDAPLFIMEYTAEHDGPRWRPSNAPQTKLTMPGGYCCGTRRGLKGAQRHHGQAIESTLQKSGSEPVRGGWVVYRVGWSSLSS